MILITLAETDAAAFRDAMARQVAAEVAASCEPSGWRIVIAATPGIGEEAWLEVGSRTISLGAVTIEGV